MDLKLPGPPYPTPWFSLPVSHWFYTLQAIHYRMRALWYCGVTVRGVESEVTNLLNTPWLPIYSLKLKSVSISVPTVPHFCSNF